MEYATKWKPLKDFKLHEDYKGLVNWTREWHELTETGSLGDPTIASAEKGEKMITQVVMELVEFVEKLKKS